MQHELIKKGQSGAQNVNFYYNGKAEDATYDASSEAFNPIVPEEEFPECLLKSAEVEFVYWFKLGWCPKNSLSATELMHTFRNLKLVITDVTRDEMLEYEFKIEKTIRFNDCTMKFGKSHRTMYMHILIKNSENMEIEAKNSTILEPMGVEETEMIIDHFEVLAEVEKRGRSARASKLNLVDPEPVVTVTARSKSTNRYSN